MNPSVIPSSDVSRIAVLSLLVSIFVCIRAWALPQTSAAAPLRSTAPSLPPTSCAPAWIPKFGPQPGMFDEVNALAVYDDSNGPALYVGGAFTAAGAVAANHIVKRDASGWRALGQGLSGTFTPAARALCVFDDGSGPALFVGGQFSLAGGAPANHVAKWNGTSWSALGTGMNTNAATSFCPPATLNVSNGFQFVW